MPSGRRSSAAAPLCFCGILHALSCPVATLSHLSLSRHSHYRPTPSSEYSPVPSLSIPVSHASHASPYVASYQFAHRAALPRHISRSRSPRIKHHPAPLPPSAPTVNIRRCSEQASRTSLWYAAAAPLPPPTPPHLSGNVPDPDDEEKEEQPQELTNPGNPAVPEPYSEASSEMSSSDEEKHAQGEPDTVEYFGVSSRTPFTGKETAPDRVPDFDSLHELPLFPLPLVLNPGSSIPLHIFEMRYRLMFNRIRDSDALFGIVFYDKEKDAIAAVGCSAELTRFEPLPDGRIMTNNVGKQRFKIVAVLDDKPYKRALVEYFRDDIPTENELQELSDLEHQVWTALLDVLRLSNKLYDKALDLGSNLKELAPKGAVTANLQSGSGSTDPRAAIEFFPEGSPSPPAPSVNSAEEASSVQDEVSSSSTTSEPRDPTRTQDFSFAVSQVLDMPLNEQQILLQTRRTSHRLRKQNKMLDTARQYLAAQVVIKDAGLKF